MIPNVVALLVITGISVDNNVSLMTSWSGEKNMGYAGYLEDIQLRLYSDIEQLKSRIKNRDVCNSQVAHHCSAILDVAQRLAKQVEDQIEYVTDPGVDLEASVRLLSIRVAELEKENRYLLAQAEKVEKERDDMRLELKRIREWHKKRN